MRKMICVIVMFGVLGAGSIRAAENIEVRLSGSVLSPGDAGYKDIYGKSVFLPELKAGLALSGPLYIWAGYGLVSKKGETAVLKYEAKSTQHFISGGAGYRGAISDKLEWMAEAGLLVAAYREEAMGVTVTGSALGVVAGAGLGWRLGEKLFLAAEAGYLFSSDKVEGKTIKPGGFKAGLGLGIRF
ncbi:MAG: porin family protein [Candidatus Aminicenantes bacterium]|nr:porin family protein [Candidatus Aminicenantes bacterium]